MLPSWNWARLFDVRVLVPGAVALVPLVITPGLFAYFDVTPKIALLLIVAALILLQPRAIAYNLRRLVSMRAGKWLAALLGVEWLAMVLATLYSTDRSLSLHGGNWRRMGLAPETGLLLFVILAAGWLAADRKNVRLLLRASVASGALAGLYGIAQYFGWDPFQPAQAYQAGEGIFTIVRPPGTLGHADYFAAWLAIIVFFGLALVVLEEKPWLRIAARGAVSLAAFAILLSGTRAAILGLLAGAVVLLLRRRGRLSTRTVGLALAATACLALFFISPAGTKLRARLHWSLDDVRGGARLLLWRDSLRMAADRPLSGFGPETFTTQFPRFESVELAHAFPDFYHESAHNILLDALTTQGFPGLLAALLLCGLGVWAAIRASRSGRPEAAALAAALVAVLASQQFMAFVFSTALYFHLLLAVLVVSCSTDPEPIPVPATRAWAFVPLAAASLMLAVFAAHLLFADAYLALAQRRIARGDAQGAAAAYRSVLAWQFPGWSADLGYSRAMQQLATNSPVFATRLLAGQQALEAAVRAVRTAEDRHNAWYQLAMLLANNSDAPGTERALRNSIAWAPNWFKPHWALAQLLELAGQHAAALTEARAAFELNAGRDPEVTETWKRLNPQASVAR